jgi:hypothetical protein
MGLLDRLFGRNRRDDGRGYAPPSQYGGPQGRSEALPDEQAVARYRYLLRTAPPEQIEQAHTEAFSQLTVDQRQQVLAQLAAAVPAGERPRTDDPETLARVATRAEMRQPGTLERALGGYGPGYGQGGYGQGGYGQRGYGGGYGGGYGAGYGGPGMGSIIGGSLLGTIGGLVIGTAIADALFDNGGEEAFAQEEAAAAEGDQGGDGGDYGGNPDADFAGGADNGWDGGGGDYGDFGGGDFGGGDF